MARVISPAPTPPGARAGAAPPGTHRWFCPHGGPMGGDCIQTRETAVPPEVAALDDEVVRGLRVATVVAGVLGILELALALARGPVHPAHLAATSTIVGVAVILFALTRSRWATPDLARGLGSLFLVVAGVGFAVAAVLGVGGSAWSAIWIAIFPLLVPCPVPVTVGKSLVAASATPAAFAVFGASGALMPGYGPAELAALFVPPYVAAGIAWGAARFLGRLGGALARAEAVGRYELVRPLGRGGMGEVWEARHQLLARPAAVKVIQPANGKAPDARERRRFEREAQVTARLKSPHTIELYDFGITEGGDYYFVMELLEGMDLEALVAAHGPLPPARVVHLLRQALDSLAEAHEQGLLHRDVKPANLFVTRRGLETDYLKVLDFGLVKERGPDGRFDVTREDRISGTPAYLAPEVVTGEGPVDGRSDLYALGCVAYFLLTGRLVFEGESPMQVAVAHATQPPVPPSERLGRPIPKPLEDLVMSALAKDPGRRPASARAMLRRLDALGPMPGWNQDDADAWWERHSAPPPAATPTPVPPGPASASDEAPADGVASPAQAPRARDVLH